jgi:hypothetical protein
LPQTKNNFGLGRDFTDVLKKLILLALYPGATSVVPLTTLHNRGFSPVEFRAFSAVYEMAF